MSGIIASSLVISSCEGNLLNAYKEFMHTQRPFSNEHKEETTCNNIFPFLHLVNCEFGSGYEEKIQFFRLNAGWTIIDYGSAIAVYAPYNISENSMIDAQANAVATAVELIASKGWSNIDLVEGSQLMNRFVWIEANRYGIELESTEYVPSDEDKKYCENLVKHIKASGLSWKKHYGDPVCDHQNST